MNEFLNDRKSIIKFVEANRQSMRNFRINGDNILSQRTTPTNCLTPTPRHDSLVSKKGERPSYQLKTLPIHHDSLLRSKDLRLKREDMANKISDLIHEINLSSVKTRSGVKTLKMVLDFLRGYFDQNNAFQTIFDFLQNYVICEPSDFPPNLVRHLSSFDIQLGESFVFKDLWLKYSENHRSNSQSEKFNSILNFKSQLNERDAKIEELTSEIKRLERCYIEERKTSNSLKALHKEKFELARELLEKRLELVNQKIIGEKLIKENICLSEKLEKMAIEKSDLFHQLNQLYNQLEDASYKFRKSQNKAQQRKTIIGQIENHKNSVLERLKGAYDIVSSFAKVIEYRLEEPDKLPLFEFSPAKSNSKETKARSKLSRFSVLKKPLDSLNQPRMSVRERMNIQQFNPSGPIDGSATKKSIEELLISRSEKTPVIKTPKKLSKTDIQGLIADTVEPKIYEILMFLSKCEITLFFAKNLHELLLILQYDIETMTRDLRVPSTQNFITPNSKTSAIFK